ncbi:14624_t:CDS:2 [Rhizophagus irregularis]|nr:14624_t:CDS:2 [Rhizophagus irregularis]
MLSMEIDYENVGNDIDLEDLENEAWLIKLPAYLFDKWADVADDDTELARVQFFVDSRGIGSQPPKQSYKLILSDIERHENEPKEYDLEVVDDNVADTYLFYQYKDDGSVSMAATAKKNFIVKPTFGVDYSRKVRQRTLQAATSTRRIKIIGDNENHGAYVPPGAYAAAITKFGNLVQKKPKVSINQKTTRMPKNELIDLLFGAFEKYTYWTLRGLKDYAKQPESYLKDVLNEIAILDKQRIDLELKDISTKTMYDCSKMILPELPQAVAFKNNTLRNNPMLCPEDRLMMLTPQLIREYISTWYCKSEWV